MVIVYYYHSYVNMHKNIKIAIFKMATSGKHSASLQLLREDYSFTYPPLCVAWDSFILLSELWGERNCQSFETAAGGE